MRKAERTLSQAKGEALCASRSGSGFREKIALTYGGRKVRI